MSDIFHNFDSNGAGEEPQDVNMTSPVRSPLNNFSGALMMKNNESMQVITGSSITAVTTIVPQPLKVSNVENQPILSKTKLLELVREIDTAVQLDEDVEETLLFIADDFIDEVVKTTSQYAKHRKSTRVEVRDIQLHLERKYRMWLPGFGTDELRPYKRAAVTEAHKQRLALIRKTIKKY